MTVRIERSTACLDLLEGFSFRIDGVDVKLQPTIQRLLAFLGLRERATRRSYVAGQLWPDASERQAAARLRSTLWRFSHPELVEADPSMLRLSDVVSVDVRRVASQARRLLSGTDLRSDDYDVTRLRQDLLPDWWDDWLVLERERVRQLRLHALEALACKLVSEGRPAEGVGAAMEAVAAEPLRESAHRVLVSAYLAEGNYGEALRHYNLFVKLLHDELGVEPTTAMRQLIQRPDDGPPQQMATSA